MTINSRQGGDVRTAEKGAKDRLCLKSARCYSANRPRCVGESARGRTSQGAKEPGGESSRGRNVKEAKKPDTVETVTLFF